MWGLGGPGDQPRAWGLNLGRAGGVEPQHARFLLDYGFTKVMSGRLCHGVGQAGSAVTLVAKWLSDDAEEGAGTPLLPYPCVCGSSVYSTTRINPMYVPCLCAFNVHLNIVSY